MTASALSPRAQDHHDRDAELGAAVAALQAGLARQRGGGRIVTCSPAALDDRSTHPISRLHLTLDTGEPTTVVWKRLRQRPDKDVHREVLLYRRLLGDGRFGAPALYASVCDDRQRRYWLFLADVGDRRLDRCGRAGWETTLRWLARLHIAHDGQATRLATLGFLTLHDEAFYRALAVAARDSLDRHGSRSALRHFDSLLPRYEGSVAQLCAQPLTLVHGGLTAHNVLLQCVGGSDTPTVRVVDWESAAIGAAVWDLAKLLAGWGTDKPALLAVHLDERCRIGGGTSQVPLGRAFAQAEALRILRDLHWWRPDCQRPAVVDGLLDRLERYWSQV